MNMDTPFPLGRHPDAAANHDPLSRNFAAKADLPVKTKYWRRWGEVLDQGNLGSCVANAGVGCLNHTSLHVAGSHLYTEDDVTGDDGYYHKVTLRDPFSGAWPPDDTGSDGLSMAKVFYEEGKISRYEHAFGLDHTLATAMRGPLIVGIPWQNGMFYPDADGIVHPTGGDADGHEVCLDGVNITHKWVRFTNSWSDAWGYFGRFYMHWADFGTLLDDGGDAVLFIK